MYAGTAGALQSPQQYCDYARIVAWKTYVSCMDLALAQVARGTPPFILGRADGCRRGYFKKWTGFQTKPLLAGSSCIGSRFTDNGDQTVTDHLTGLVWEKKTNLDMNVNAADPHDADNTYGWSYSAIENGPVFTDFLAKLNSGTGFAGSNGWRLPTVEELDSTTLVFPCSGAVHGPKCQCQSAPCIDPSLDPNNTQSGIYWSATSDITDPTQVWYEEVALGGVDVGYKNGLVFARAVRGGL